MNVPALRDRIYQLEHDAAEAINDALQRFKSDTGVMPDDIDIGCNDQGVEYVDVTLEIKPRQ